jgi:hypothetical protein
MGRPRVKSETDRIYVNISAELGRRLRDLAAQERRTLKAQVEILLERSLAATSTNGVHTLADEPADVAAA